MVVLELIQVLLGLVGAFICVEIQCYALISDKSKHVQKCFMMNTPFFFKERKGSILDAVGCVYIAGCQVMKNLKNCKVMDVRQNAFDIIICGCACVE